MNQALIADNTSGDEYVTPIGAVKVLQHNLTWFPAKTQIWEPCDPLETSMITKAFRRMGYSVVTTGLPKTDFLQLRKPPKGAGCIITNPPYSLKDEFLSQCFSLGLPFCLLLPITALEGIYRGNLFRQYGIQVLVLDRRVQFLEGKSVYFNTSWFCWSPATPLLEHDLVFAHLPERNRECMSPKAYQPRNRV